MLFAFTYFSDIFFLVFLVFFVFVFLFCFFFVSLFYFSYALALSNTLLFFNSSLIIQRLQSLVFPHGKPLSVALVTNLFHMQRFHEAFAPIDNVTFYPVYAEDYTCLLNSTYNGIDWIDTVISYYGLNFAGVYDLVKMQSIMTSRRAGDFSVSVASFCSGC